MEHVFGVKKRWGYLGAYEGWSSKGKFGFCIKTLRFVKDFLKKYMPYKPDFGSVVSYLQLSCSSHPFSKVNCNSSEKGNSCVVARSWIQISFCFCVSGIREDRKCCRATRSHRKSFKGYNEFMIAAIRSPAGSLSPQ